ncbi:MAG: TfoX/Sxy family protein [Deltaproteobacteria bacterium]|nr:TfoX/Sxy family protein [Deltaproteobacteria bacterium]
MAWVKVPPENRPQFHAALPSDPRVEVQPMFGGLAARLNGNIFAGLFGRSTVVELPEPLREKALALDGAEPFDPMGNGKWKSHKVMLPEDVMHDLAELRHWIGLAHKHAETLPPKEKKGKAKAARSAQKAPPKAKPKPVRPAVPKRRGPAKRK